jgi:CheY-like chemotaxis protein
MSAENLHILLVDDHDESLFVLARLLEKCGHKVTTAQDYATAVAAATGSGARFDLLISDVGLPDRSGLELMQEMRSSHGLKGIALSGFTDQLDAAASQGAGFAKHLNKPVVFAELVTAIKEVIGWCPPSHESMGAAFPSAN